jgi:hypothetical protein
VEAQGYGGSQAWQQQQQQQQQQLVLFQPPMPAPWFPAFGGACYGGTPTFTTTDAGSCGQLSDLDCFVMQQIAAFNPVAACPHPGEPRGVVGEPGRQQPWNAH